MFSIVETTSQTPSIDNLNASSPERDNEAVSLCAKSVNGVEKFLNQCLRQNKQLDTSAVIHLLSKLHSDICKIYACMSPFNCVGLPYFENYVMPNYRKQLLCILLCDGVHFQGYIVDINRNKIIHIESLSCNNSNNCTSKTTVKSIFESGANVQYESLFATRK